MKTVFVTASLLLALSASGAIADTLHYATAPTEKQAKRLATADARATSRASARCYRPARQVKECQAVEGGFRCRAESSASYNTCKRAGWVYDPSRAHSASWMDALVGIDTRSSSPWPSKTASSEGVYAYGGGSTPISSGPPLPPPFPQAPN